jgi:hypothetical protein
MELAIHASSDSAPRAFARRSTSTWTDGVTVAVLTKIVPRGSASSESPVSAKIVCIAASSVTTVTTTFASAGISARVVATFAPVSRADRAADSARVS